MTVKFHPDCQSNDFPVEQNGKKVPSQQQSIGGHVSDQDSPNQVSHVSNIEYEDDIRPRLTANYLGVFRHPFLGKAELLYDDKHTPRLVLNDKWTSRIYEVKADHSNHGKSRGAGQSEQLLLLHCFFDNIPWQPDLFKVFVNFSCVIHP